MTNNFKSIHLETYNSSKIKKLSFDEDIIKKMDLIKEICSTIFSIRKEKNLRVRLPLNSVTIFTNFNFNNSDIEIIKTETNVKEVFIRKDSFDSVAEEFVKLDFKKLGLRLKDDIKKVTSLIKENKFKKNKDGSILVDEFKILPDEFIYLYKPKDEKFSIQVCFNNSILVLLDIKITDELEKEGFVRDFIRSVQIFRKEQNLNINDVVEINVSVSNVDKFYKYIEFFIPFIKEQTLISEFNLKEDNNLKELNYELFI